ncbi:MAG: histidinol-phosphate transaminase [Sedimentisphaerales bacterium]|nr:histidinol-phosphate transaminase [Sedimentisphaerales bacterium]
MGYFRENIEAMKGYQPGFQPKEADVVKLNTNENPYPPSPKVMEALASITSEKLRRYPDPAGDEFRRAAAEVNGIGADHIMCSNGGDDLLTVVFRAFCGPGRAVAYPVPTYSLYPVLAKIQDCEAVEIAFDEEFNLPAKLAGTGAALTIVCNPNAPSGSFVSVEELASLADELSGVLLIDEAYVDFAERNCTELVGRFDNVIVLRSMSKGYSLAGMRFGYAMARASLIEGLMKVRDSYNVDAVAIAVAAAAIKDQEYFRQCVEKVKTERSRMTEQLRAMGLDVPASHSNFLLARCNGADASEIHERLARQGVYVRYFPYPRLEDKLRITIGTAEQNERLLAALNEILKD